jgi:alkaline phosphatase
MQLLGHDGPPAGIWTTNLVTKEPLARCPLRSIQLAREHAPTLSANVDRHVDLLYPAYREGHLLVSGGIADQPNHYVEMMRVIRDMEALGEAVYRRITAENGEH